MRKKKEPTIKNSVLSAQLAKMGNDFIGLFSPYTLGSISEEQFNQFLIASKAILKLSELVKP